MITTSQFKSGLTIEYEGQLYSIVEYQHVKPGKGGAFVRTKLRSLKTKKIIEKTFRPDEKFQDIFVDEKKMQYLYCSGDTYHFMDQETFEEFILDKEQVADIASYMKENTDVDVVMCKQEVIEVKLPIFVILKIEHTEPGIKGDTARNSFKPATLETGATIQVPLFINEGDLIKIDTRTGVYVERA